MTVKTFLNCTILGRGYSAQKKKKANYVLRNQFARPPSCFAVIVSPCMSATVPSPCLLLLSCLLKYPELKP